MNVIIRKRPVQIQEQIANRIHPAVNNNKLNDPKVSRIKNSMRTNEAIPLSTYLNEVSHVIWVTKHNTIPQNCVEYNSFCCTVKFKKGKKRKRQTQYLSTVLKVCDIRGSRLESTRDHKMAVMLFSIVLWPPNLVNKQP